MTLVFRIHQPVEFVRLVYTDTEGHLLCEDDLAVLQAFLDSSVTTNPYMDDPSSWFWTTINGENYYLQDGDGVVEPLELGLQEWEQGRLTSLMCGAYILL